MKKYIVNYLTKKGSKGSAGVQTESPEMAIDIVKTVYPGMYGFRFANVTVTSVDEWQNKRIRVLD